jgi:hypothetical protein
MFLKFRPKYEILGSEFRDYLPSTSFTFAPIVAGLSTTWIPHSRITFFLAAALSSAPAYDGTSVAHGAACGRGFTSDEADDRVFAVGFDPLRGLDLQVTADLADHYDGLGVRVVGKELHGLQALWCR